MTGFNDALRRTDLGEILVPTGISNQILDYMPQSSVVLTNANKSSMGTKTVKQPLLATTPEAYFLESGNDKALKQTTTMTFKETSMTAEEIAVIVPVPDAVRDDASIDLGAYMMPYVAEAFGKKIDKAVIYGEDKPTTWGTDFKSGAATAGLKLAAGKNADLAADIAELNRKMAEKGVSHTGYITEPGMRWKLIGLRNTSGFPIYADSPAAGQPGTLYGMPMGELTNGAWAYKPEANRNTTDPMLFAVDWDKIRIGIRQDFTVKFLDQAVISDADGKVVYNLAQQDATAYRFVMRLAYQPIVPISPLDKSDTRFPVGMLTYPAATTGTSS